LEQELDLKRAADVAASSRFAQVNQLTRSLVDAAKVDAVLPYAVADDYLRVVALALLGWAWSRIETAANADAVRWRTPKVLHTRVLPEFDMWINSIGLQCQAALNA
jgi:MoxR-like ATPase